MRGIVVNFFAGPGAGKSTMAASVFSELKWSGINCELVPEYAKEKVWEESFKVLENQRLIYGKQYHMLLRAVEKVDIAITDSPILLTAAYAKIPGDEKLVDLAVDDFKNGFKNINFFLNRRKKYCVSGRTQNEEEARLLDAKIRKILNDQEIEFSSFVGEKKSVSLIVNKILDFYDAFKKQNG